MAGKVDTQETRRRRPEWANRLVRTLCSGGVEPEVFNEVKGEFEARNRRSMFTLSVLGIVEGLMLISGYVMNGNYVPAFSVYVALLVVCAAIAALSRSRFLRRSDWLLVACFVALSAAMLYGLGIAFQHPAPDDYPAITFMVLFVALPLMFTDVVWRMVLFQVVWATVFSVLSWRLSSPWVFGLNLVDAVTFTALGAVLYCTISCEHVRQVVDHLELEEESARLSAMQGAILMRLSNVIEGRDEDTGGHVTRTCAFVADLLEDLCELPEWRNRLTDSFISYSVICASIHDMGKLQIPDAILNKPGPLTDEEFAEMKLHTVYGEALVTSTLEGIVGPEELSIAQHIARSHHERWDGRGYPDGLAGEEIPVEARAMALADVFDALTHERCYKRAFSVDEAIAIIEEGRGTQFDPVMCDVFVARRRREGNTVGEGRMRHLQRVLTGKALRDDAFVD